MYLNPLGSTTIQTWQQVAWPMGVLLVICAGKSLHSGIALKLYCHHLVARPGSNFWQKRKSWWSVQKNPVVTQTERDRVEWTEFSSGIWWTCKWTFRYQTVNFWIWWFSGGLLSGVNCYFHDRCWCVGVGASRFWPGCARVAVKETALPQPSSTQWAGC